MNDKMTWVSHIRNGVDSRQSRMRGGGYLGWSSDVWQSIMAYVKNRILNASVNRA